MNRLIFVLVVGASLALLGPQAASARYRWSTHQRITIPGESASREHIGVNRIPRNRIPVSRIPASPSRTATPEQLAAGPTTWQPAADGLSRGKRSVANGCRLWPIVRWEGCNGICRGRAQAAAQPCRVPAVQPLGMPRPSRNSRQVLRRQGRSRRLAAAGTQSARSVRRRRVQPLDMPRPSRSSRKSLAPVVQPPDMLQQNTISPRSAAADGAAAGYAAAAHRTTAVPDSVAAAAGAAVRTSYNGYGAQLSAWSPAGWTAGQAMECGHLARGRNVAGLGRRHAANAVYNYGTNITYQGNQVYYGSQPVATADQYYQQASTLAQSAPPPDPKATDWMPLGVFALVQNDQAEPHYVMQLAVNKAGTLGGNYSDLISGTNLPIQGARG